MVNVHLAHIACTPLILRSIETGRLPGEDPQKAGHMEAGYVIPPTEAGSQHLTRTSTSPRLILTRGRICTWKTPTRSSSNDKRSGRDYMRYGFIGLGHNGAAWASSLQRKGFP